MGSTTGLTDSNGVVTESASYDSFGRTISSNLTTRYQYTGREYDEYTGLMFYRARFYDPQIGRFISEDPIRFEGGLDFYLYAENNPIRKKDPYGLAPWDYVLFLYYAHYCLKEGLACKENTQREFNNDPCKWAENNPNYSSPIEQNYRECFLVNPNCQNMWYYGTKAGVTDWPIGKGPLGGVNSIKDGRPSVDPLVKP